MALIDTGAVNSVIDESLARKLKLKKRGEAPLGGVDGKLDYHDVFYVNVCFSNSNIFFNMMVPSINFNNFLKSDGFIIGMDILSRGNFYLFNNGNKNIIKFEFDHICETLNLELIENPPINNTQDNANKTN